MMLHNFSCTQKDDIWQEKVESKSNLQTDSNELLVPKSMVGRIIGKAGARIKEIRESTGAKIDVSITFK